MFGEDLEGFLNFAVTQAARADTQAHIAAIHNSPNALQIDVPAPTRYVVSVRNSVSITRAFAADFA